MTLRFGIAFCTTHIPAADHGCGTITAVRCAPSPAFAELADSTLMPEWLSPGLEWSQDDDGTLQLGSRSFEQAVIEIDGNAGASA